MPIYTYRCDKCGSSYELLGKMEVEDPKDFTPECFMCGAALRKVPSAPNFTVKGYSAKNGYSK
jgi:putative FmdB family regulatory protein